MAAINSAQPKPRVDAIQAPAHNPWAIALTVTMATFMELLDTSISNVSLPHIAGGLGCSYDESTWVLTSYLVANAIILPMSAWLSRVFGRKRYYMMCVALFTATSFLCGVAPTLSMLIVFRVLQGIGGGGLAPVEQAILVDTFPKEKLGGAFALYSMAMVVAPAIGPPLGGWITDNFSWRWVFFINVPIGLLSLLLSSRLVHDPVEFTEERKQARQSGRLKIDYVGIVLIAVGFACLEVVLDRGERDDWLESHFIATFLVIAVVAIAIAIWWEWRHDDPVVELTLLRERNFAIANVYYFIFGFGLFGSTVMIPEMLQTLFGYTATDAGLVLGPGAAVITVLAPFVARTVPRIGVKRLLAFSFTVAALSFFYYSGMTTQTDYFHFAFARAFQGFGYAFMFIPVSQLAYSYLPKNKNNKGSSIMNLCRNWGASFGISFVTTMLERRTEYHQSVLVSHLTSADPSVRQFVNASSHFLVTRGSSTPDAIHQAYGMVGNIMTQQATMLAFMDCFHLLAIVVLAGLPLALLIRRFEIAKRQALRIEKLKSPNRGDLNMRAVQLTAYGDPVEGLNFVNIPAPEVPGPNQVLIGIEFSPVNPSDLLLAQGIYGLRPALPSVIGNEGVGRVLAAGSRVKNVKVGDRVVAPLSSFTWREQMVVSADGLFALPADADPQQLSMLAINPPTAALLLSEYVDLKPGEWVVQDSANSSVGRWVIAFAKARGLKTVNIVRRQELVAELKAIGGDVVVVDSPEVSKEIKVAIGKAEIRLALDGVSGPASGVLASTLSPHGTLVSYAAMSSKPISISPLDVIFKPLTVRGFWLGHPETAAKAAPAIAQAAEMIASGKVTIPVAATYPLSSIKEAVAHAVRGGKILLDVCGGSN